jgi:hypothetical protein
MFTIARNRRAAVLTAVLRGATEVVFRDAASAFRSYFQVVPAPTKPPEAKPTTP